MALKIGPWKSRYTFMLNLRKEANVYIFFSNCSTGPNSSGFSCRAAHKYLNFAESRLGEDYWNTQDLVKTWEKHWSEEQQGGGGWDIFEGWIWANGRIFHQPGFHWNKGDLPFLATFWGEAVWGRYNLTRWICWCDFGICISHELFLQHHSAVQTLTDGTLCHRGPPPATSHEVDHPHEPNA